MWMEGMFAVEGRQSLLQPEPDEELRKCFTGIVSDLFQTPGQSPADEEPEFGGLPRYRPL
jgi:hypothetical protein